MKHPVRLRQPAALALAALLASLALTGCQSERPTPPEPASQGSSTVNTSEFSTLDAAGVDQILATSTATLDMSSGALAKADVGVAEESYGPEINARNAGKIDLTIKGPDGVITGDTGRIRFNTTDARPDFSEVTYFLTATSPEEYFALIRDGVNRYGIDSDSAERWITATEADLTSKDEFAITPGTATGLEVSYDLRYDGSQETQVIIVHVFPAPL
ncbi:hypothetical protein [Pseudarthrobacter sp. PS3-L1]|uniref:hypothetical protein n=1 Tax=Pseudarthrobacter sp. PS3-L1 TaxID=3046207 RepID=UPI0024BB0981|nr:hypothetical protein [Pseudarthrobacter sp. PS3-L1]MDJ0321077.1 hypothetical protein [Pseudarthrobacter sp. PS3-L1]